MATGNTTTVFSTNAVTFDAPVTLNAAVTAPTLATVNGVQVLTQKTIQFLNPNSQVATPLTIYSEAAEPATFSGAISPQIRTVSFWRVNNLITCYIPIVGSAQIVNAAITTNLFIPPPMRPGTNISVGVIILNNNAPAAGRIDVSTSGQITISRDLISGTAFGNTGNQCGLASAVTFSYQA